jgi:hypothetical protein
VYAVLSDAILLKVRSISLSEVLRLIHQCITDIALAIRDKLAYPYLAYEMNSLAGFLCVLCGEKTFTGICYNR